MELTGYVGLTDRDWYSFLCARPRVDEVNFWQPHGERAFRAIPRGAPFFFKLRAPHKAIAGFGFFERYESLPAWQAWDFFGEMNGAPTLEAMVDRIVRLRDDPAGEVDALRGGSFQIGCILLTAPVFLAPEEWVFPPADWARTGIQQGKRYDLGVGEGRRILEECLERARAAGRYWNVEERPLVAEGAERYGSPLLVRPRLGQGTFSLAVRDAYGRACAVTHEHSEPVLEAAHIRPYSKGGAHQIVNGLLLRTDLHRLFDKGYVTVTPDYVFRVGDRLRDEYRNGRSYYALKDTPIALPDDTRLRPDRELLEWHGQAIFRG